MIVAGVSVGLACIISAATAAAVGAAALVPKKFGNESESLTLSLPKNVVFANKAAFDALDKPTQEALAKCAREAEARGWRISEEKNKWYLEQLAKNGMAVQPPSAQLKADFRKIGDTMTAEWLKTAGADGQAIVEAYKK